MTLKIHNTLTSKKEEFIPQEKNKVKMYVCGITAYDFCHLGHARAYITFDIIKRYLEYKGFKVTYIQNITDIDDKIIKRAKELKKTEKELVEYFTNEFFSDMDALGVKKADKYPRATENIKEIIKSVQILIDKGHAYELNGSVYFSVKSFKDYGKLSKKNIDELLSGARVEVDKNKKDPLDFALWKKSKEGEPKWESPWGKGRPGWHIECSVMSQKYLSETFDMHGGGKDLIFPHHENEIAQAESLTGRQFVKYWIHNGFVTINKEKMSKSLGNFFTIKDILKKYDPEAIRYFLLTTHYASPINFSDDQLEQAKTALDRLYNTIENAHSNLPRKLKLATTEDKDNIDVTADVAAGFSLRDLKQKFEEAMDDDFNTAQALAVLFEISKYINSTSDPEGLKLLKELGGILGLLQKEKKEEKLDKELEDLIKEREKARALKNFKRGDEIRNLLQEKGILIEDTPQGTRWKKL